MRNPLRPSKSDPVDRQKFNGKDCCPRCGACACNTCSPRDICRNCGQKFVTFTAPLTNLGDLGNAV